MVDGGNQIAIIGEGALTRSSLDTTACRERTYARNVGAVFASDAVHTRQMQKVSTSRGCGVMFLCFSVHRQTRSRHLLWIRRRSTIRL